MYRGNGLTLVLIQKFGVDLAHVDHENVACVKYGYQSRWMKLRSLLDEGAIDCSDKPHDQSRTRKFRFPHSPFH